MLDHNLSTILLSTHPSERSDRRTTLVVLLLLLAYFVAALPFARISLPRFPAFILIQESLLLANDLITAMLLFGQYAIGRTRRLDILAGGYLLTALIMIPHALTFPGVFSETGLLGAGPQSAAWLYIGWHAVLPVTIILFGLRSYDIINVAAKVSVRWPIQMASLMAVGGVVIMTALATWGHTWLPQLLEGDHYTPAARVAVGVLLGLPLVALIILARRKHRSVLDEWLMVVMAAWLLTISLGAFISSGRYDVGWYLGRAFDWLASVVVLVMLLSETLVLYARNVRAAANERLQRERRLKETEAVLIHLSRVNELGRNVAMLVHEIGQPIAGISMIAAAMKHTNSPKQLRQLVDSLLEATQGAKTTILHLRNFLKNNEPERRVQEIPAMIDAALELVFLSSTSAASIDTRYSVDATTAFFDRVQIEQVVFNLAHNAIEAMTDSSRRILTNCDGPCQRGHD
jgi:signal transduction histidine kinase